MYSLVGYMRTKYGFLGYFEQEAESDEQIHVGLKVCTAFIKKEETPVLGDRYVIKRYEQTGKDYAFKK